MKRWYKKWISDVIKSFKDIINWSFYINYAITDINNSKIFVIYKILSRDIAKSNLWFH